MSVVSAFPNGGENYSTDEQIIGTWIDGSYIYKITKSCGLQMKQNFTSLTNLEIDITSLNVNRIIDVEGMWYMDGYTGVFMEYETDGFLWYPVWSLSNNTKFQHAVKGQWSAIQGAYITFIYTKQS